MGNKGKDPKEISADQEEAKNREHDRILMMMQQFDREIRRTATPVRRHQPRVTRMQSSRMRTVSSGTSNGVKAIYQSPEQAARTTITGEPEYTTREVGPGDRYNKDYTCEGKETKSR